VCVVSESAAGTQAQAALIVSVPQKDDWLQMGLMMGDCTISNKFV